MDKTRRLSARTLLDNPIHNLHGDRLGDLNDIVLDASSGQPIYAVLSVGGLLGMGEKYFAVPWHAMQIETEHEHRILLDASSERLKAATGFDKDHWPDEADAGFTERVHTSYT